LDPTLCSGGFYPWQIISNGEWTQSRLLEAKGWLHWTRPGEKIRCVFLASVEGRILGAGRVEALSPEGWGRWRAWLPDRKLSPGPVRVYALLGTEGICLLGEKSRKE
jgi:hypothetical protein